VLVRGLLAFGERKPIREWLVDARCAVTAKTLAKRLSEGMSPEQALSTPRSRPPIDMPIGLRIGCLTVAGPKTLRFTEMGCRVYEVAVKCDCGQERQINVLALRRSTPSSCGWHCELRARKTTEEHKEVQRQWRIRNKARRAMYVKAWKAAHPGAVAGYDATRRAVIAWSEADDDKVNAIYAKSKGDGAIPCYLCGAETAKDDRHVDHKVPLSKGGLHVSDNLAIACVSCNLKKGAKAPDAA
jgi:5-methylcytosine-specific restriction endonuclease McrA